MPYSSGYDGICRLCANRGTRARDSSGTETEWSKIDKAWKLAKVANDAKEKADATHRAHGGPNTLLNPRFSWYASARSSAHFP